MGLDLTIKSCCDNPLYHRYMSGEIEVDFGSDGWPIVHCIQDGLNHSFNDCYNTVHLTHSEFCALIICLKSYEYDDKNKFIGDERWFDLGVMVGCCKDCGVDVFASW